MDKWKEIELEKMKAGGNKNARLFFDEQDDWNDSMSIQQRYNTKAAALYRDKIATLAQGKEWTAENSSARNYSSSSVPSSSVNSGMHYSKSAGSLSGGGGGGYQDGGGGGGYQNFNSQEFKDQKEMFFNKKQSENQTRPEYTKGN